MPHMPQNRWSFGLSCPQLPQSTMVSPVLDDVEEAELL
jgi:hypothetical protein